MYKYFLKNYSVINTKYGKIKGLKKKYNDKIIFCYYNIPYAQPPLNNLR